MYAPNLNSRDRGGAVVAVVLIHVGIAIGILNATGHIDIPRDLQRTLKVFDVDQPEPPPPPPPSLSTDRPKEKEGAAAPKNIESKATPVAAPKPRIVIPVPPKIAVAETPREGTEPTQGASDVRGPGTGAGGAGNGTGSGGAGSGSGGGGGGIAEGAHLVRGITNRDYPRDIQRNWPPGGAIFLRLRIGPDGRATQCDVMRSFGDPAADRLTCTLITQRGVFRPALDRSGRPVASWYGYIQRETGRFDR